MKQIFSHLIAATALMLAACTGDNAEGGSKQPGGGNPEGIVAVKEAQTHEGEATVLTDDMICGLVVETQQLLLAEGVEPGEALDEGDIVVFMLDGRELLRMPFVRELPQSKEQRVLYAHFDSAYGYMYFIFGGLSDEAWRMLVDHLAATGRIVELPQAPEQPADPDNGYADCRTHLSPWEDTGEIALVRLPLTKIVSDIKPNRLHVIRDAATLASIAATDADIDFDTHTVLAVRLVTPNGIHAVESGLDRTEEGYTYRVEAKTDCTEVIGDEMLLVAARIDADARIEFLLEPQLPACYYE